jgi:hypothetical protein
MRFITITLIGGGPTGGPDHAVLAPPVAITG